MVFTSVLPKCMAHSGHFLFLFSINSWTHPLQNMWLQVERMQFFISICRKHGNIHHGHQTWQRRPDEAKEVVGGVHQNHSHSDKTASGRDVRKAGKTLPTARYRHSVRRPSRALLALRAKHFPPRGACHCASSLAIADVRCKPDTSGPFYTGQPPSPSRLRRPCRCPCQHARFSRSSSPAYAVGWMQWSSWEVGPKQDNMSTRNTCV